MSTASFSGSNSVTQEHEPILINPTLTIDEEPEGLLFTSQHDIPEDFISECRAERIDADHAQMGEMYRFARIPVGLYDQWIRAGIDVNNLTIKETIRLLQKREMDSFITTNKQLY
jgi:hypothetical protein